MDTRDAGAFPSYIFLSREADSPRAGSALWRLVSCLPICVVVQASRKFHLRGEPGTLVAFRSETTHEVTPVTHGERYSIVSWFR